MLCSCYAGGCNLFHVFVICRYQCITLTLPNGLPPPSGQVAADERFELVVPPRFGLVCFRLRGCTNQANAELLEAVNRSGGHGAVPNNARGVLPSYRVAWRWLVCPARVSCSYCKHTSIVLCSPHNLHAGTAFLSHTMLSGRYVIRCALGGTLTQGCHVETAWRTVQRCAGAVLVA